MALSVFAVIAVAVLPLLLTSLKATTKVKLETKAKNVTQLQLERMRGLTFHVDRQNGPFLDLLDLYFTNASNAVQVRSDGTTGVFLAEAGGVGGAPSGPAYRVTTPAVQGEPGFSQQVYTQFLRTTATRAVVPLTYDSQTVGQDSPPSQLVSITVLTAWTLGGGGSLRTYTEVADESSSVAFITSQAQALALRVTSTSADQAQTLIGQVGLAKADGSLTTGSVAGVQGEGVSAELLGLDRIVGAVSDASAPSNAVPANPAGTSGTSANGIALQLGASGCGWASFGKSRVADASATTAAGYPVVPSNAPTDVTAVGAAMTRAGLVTSGTGCGGKSFAWRNYVEAPSYPSTFGVANNLPLVFINDVGGGGDLEAAAPVAVGRVAVSATGLLEVPRSVTAIASASTAVVRVMPTTDRPNGLVTAELKSSQASCRSAQVVQASYTLHLRWPGQTVDKVFTLLNAGTLPTPESISFLEGGLVRNLGEYLSWGLANAATEGTNGIRSLGPVFTLSGKAAAVGRDFNLALGTLSCVADDNR